MGRFRVIECAKAIAKWNKDHGTDIRVRLGSGEDLFRQGGFFDIEGVRPLLKGFSEQELKEMKTAKEKLGKNWKNKLKKNQDISPVVTRNLRRLMTLENTLGENWKDMTKPMYGFAWLLKKYPFFNQFTNQSRSRTDVIYATPDEVMQVMKACVATRNKNMKQVKSYDRDEDLFKTTAHASKETYHKIIGNSEKKDTQKQDGLIGLATIIETIAKLNPPTRDRSASRDAHNQSLITKLTNIQKDPSINARAIGSNTASLMIFDLALLGMGSALDKAQQEDKLQTFICNHIPSKVMLRHMQLFGSIAQDIFDLLRQEGYDKLAKQLQSEWKLLLKYKAHIQDQLWQDISQKNDDKAIKDLSKLDKQQKISLIQEIAEYDPQLAELLTHKDLLDQKVQNNIKNDISGHEMLVSRDVMIYKENFENNIKDNLKTTLQYLKQSQNLLEKYNAYIDTYLESINIQENVGVRREDVAEIFRKNLDNQRLDNKQVSENTVGSFTIYCSKNNDEIIELRNLYKTIQDTMSAFNQEQLHRAVKINGTMQYF